MIKSIIKKFPPLRYVVSVLYRSRIPFWYHGKTFKSIFKWIFINKETTNFTYPITEMNKKYLASIISEITSTDYKKVYGYFEELENNKELFNHIVKFAKNSDRNFVTDFTPLYGRRIGWYALTRILKPKVVVETGVEKGLGSCVLTSALEKNANEGYPGYYYGTDINPDAGFLLGDKYLNYGKILYGDSITSLKNLNQNIDLFINDSDHSADYEYDEYITIKDKISDKCVILGDNSHCTTKLLEFSLLTNRKFVFFKEEPENHWYPGSGIGISYTDKIKV
ncbi:MAG TPA: class I SAM-dependent methyltransferase [Melioribacteraceae bacterium]|nr:class I SAM-dependent methyltransferase [Melioribacteraceae bacterium]